MRNLFFLLGALLVIAACQQDKGQYTPGGTRYVIHTDVDGPLPQPGEYIYFHYQVRNGDSVYYSSRVLGPDETPFMQIPLNPAPDRAAPPPEEVLALMSVGDSATFEIRLDTLPEKPQGFENAEAIIYDVVAVDIKTQEEYNEIVAKLREEAAVRRQAAQERFSEVEQMVTETANSYRNDKLDGQLQSTDSGLKYLIHEEGTGEQAAAGKVVDVQYYGMLTDGTMFDNSFQRGDPFQFRLGMGQVIPGWDEGIALLKEGAKATLFIPSDLGYGPQGSGPIPPESELIFYVELEKVQ
jgi:FKBP-type peptidyl-prolyl cis-trans isomerase FkpA